jgi:hypothetical protein
MSVRSFEPISPSRDITTTRTFLHEVIPITGSIMSGTYTDGDTETNIKNFTHGMFQSVYDYPYLSSSANHIFDLTAGYTAESSLSASSNTQNNKKINMYNQFAQTLLGYTGSGNNIRQFESDLTLDQVNQMQDVFIISLSRLLTKDEIKKGSFQMTVGRGAHGSAFDSEPATTTFTFSDKPNEETTITLLDSDGTTAVFEIDSDDDSSSSNHHVVVSGSGAGGTAGARTATALGNAINGVAALDMTAAIDGAKLTITQGTTGTDGNTNITLSNSTNWNACTSVNVGSAFAGGTDTDLTLYDATAQVDGTGVINCDGGDMAILHTSSDASIGDIGYGAIFYQAGVVVLSSSVFANVAEFGSANQFIGGADSNVSLTAEQTLVQSSISGTCDALRHRIKNLQFNNTTELNSTVYFCRAPTNKFNYSSNPTYLSGSKIRIKNVSTDNPVAYVTTVGLYNAANELLAVAKLSEPLRKSVDNELTIRVRLDY